MDLKKMAAEDIQKFSELIDKKEFTSVMGFLNHCYMPEKKRYVEIIESKIDTGDLFYLHASNDILSQILTKEELLDLCIKWKSDSKKEYVVIDMLSYILSQFLNIQVYEDSITRNKAIEIVKEIATTKKIDYDKLTKSINNGSDAKDIKKNKENTLKALTFIRELKFPKKPINIERLKSNLKNAPNICKKFGEKSLLRNAESKNPIIINYIFGSDDTGYQKYLDNIFKILDDYSIDYPIKKFNDVDSGSSIISEIEIIAKLAPYFNIRLEPDLAELRPNNLDISVEYNGESVLIEIATVKNRIELDLANDALFLPDGKVKSVLLSKFKKQLKEGEIKISIPIIILLKCLDTIDKTEVLNSLYGEVKYSIVGNDKGENVLQCVRDPNGFFNIEKSEVVTLIGEYRFDPYLSDKIFGRFYKPLKSPQNKISPMFLIRLRKAIFNNSETGDWKSLMKIGIDELTTKRLYDLGILDIRELAFIEKGDYIDDIPWEEISRYKVEAMRVIMALSTNSIKYLKGMDNDTLKILDEQGVAYIPELIKLNRAPSGIDNSKWDTILNDAILISK